MKINVIPAISIFFLFLNFSTKKYTIELIPLVSLINWNVPAITKINSDKKNKDIPSLENKTNIGENIPLKILIPLCSGSLIYFV